MGTLYIVIGRHNTRKSSTIRALTGVARGHDDWRVATIRGGVRRFIVILASPQENLDGFEKRLKAIDEADEAYDILMALHPDKKASDFIRQVREQNRREIRWVLLAMSYEEALPGLPDILPGPDHVELTTDHEERPVNAIAHDIRQLWGWL